MTDQSSQDESAPDDLFGQRVIVLEDGTVAILTIDEILEELESEE